MAEFNFKPVQIGGFKYYHINANGTHGLSPTIGTLHTITVNTAGGAGNICMVYDGTNVIANIDTTVAGTLTYDICYRSTLAIVLAGGTAADITIAYSF